MSAALVIAALAVSACGNGGAPLPSATPQRPELTVIAVGQDFGAGLNRLPLAVLMADGAGVIDRAANLEVTYSLATGGAQRKVDRLVWWAWPVLGGVYVGFAEFDVAGIWELKVTLTEGGRRLSGSAFVEVRQKPAAPAVGDAAPAVATKTGATPEELRLITSASQPDPDLYRVSLSDAVRSGKPTVVTFSTPAFCQTQTCGPQVEVVGRLQDRYGDRANFIHVEVYDNPAEILEKGDLSIARLAPAIAEWKLESEPWTFLIDASGRIFAKFEAFTTEEELDEAVQALLGA